MYSVKRNESGRTKHPDLIQWGPILHTACAQIYRHDMVRLGEAGEGCQLFHGLSKGRGRQFKRRGDRTSNHLCDDRPRGDSTARDRGHSYRHLKRKQGYQNYIGPANPYLI